MGVTKLVDPDLLRARALMMLERRLKGHSPAAIAAEFHVSEHTVEREVKRAKRLGLLDDYQDQIVERLMPAAIQAFEKALANGDTAVARDVFKGLGFLLTPAERAQAAPADDGDNSDLEIYVRRTYGGGSERTQFKPGPRARVEALAPAGPSVADEGSVLEGSLVGPASASAGVGASGDENRPAHDGEGLGISDDAAGPRTE